MLLAGKGELANPQAEISFVLERKKPSAAGNPSTDFHTKQGLGGTRPRRKMPQGPPPPLPRLGLSFPTTSLEERLLELF